MEKPLAKGFFNGYDGENLHTGRKHPMTKILFICHGRIYRA